MAFPLSEQLIQVIAGLASGSLLFLIASGLTHLFGALRLINSADDSLYMLGAYVTVWLTPAGGLAIAAFWLVFLGAAVLIVVGVAEALGTLWVPQASIAIVFVLLVAVLAIRPQGLMGHRA